MYFRMSFIVKFFQILQLNNKIGINWLQKLEPQDKNVNILFTLTYEHGLHRKF
jgi:hypothetical protein